MIEMNPMGFRIINSSFEKEFGVAQFMFMGYEVSMSEMGRDKGACVTPVAVFKGDSHVKDFESVEEAINFVIAEND